MSDYQSPNSDQAAEGSLPGVLNEMLNNWLRDSVDDMLPAVVVSFDGKTASIKPLVNIFTTENLSIPRPVFSSVPVFRYGGGGFIQGYKLKPGDTGWLKATDRDMSLIRQRGWLQDIPNTKRLHSFEDAMFFPDETKASAPSSADWYVASSDGSVKIEATTSAITLTVGAQVLLLNDSGLFNNGVPIGSTHRHGGVQTGGGTSGGPTA